MDEEGNIINNSYFLELMELLDEEQATQDPPTCYGNLHDYTSPLISRLSESMKVRKEFVMPKSDYANHGAGKAITFRYDLTLHDPIIQLEVPSPRSPFPYAMGESPPSDLKSARLLDCIA